MAKQELMSRTMNISKNGTNPQSFPYSEFISKGLCHMQIEDFSGDDYANTPTFGLTSNDAVQPRTWGLSALRLLGGDDSATTIVSPSTIVTSKAVKTTAVSSSSSSTTESTFTILPLTTRRNLATNSPSLPSPPRSLGVAAKAGISIGSIFCVLALIITVLLIRIARRSRRTVTRRTKPKSSDQSRNHQARLPNEVTEIGEGAYYEVNGVARPNELFGIPRSELHWESRVELNTSSTRRNPETIF
ncbi:MAG: hypothetical protein LQ351_004802 [Letrouitia transgressa]|nr:MAG: hypothetical protein LQ351_004802 [Letrouitia transgressa]